jgi:hypothetical protein
LHPVKYESKDSILIAKPSFIEEKSDMSFSNSRLQVPNPETLFNSKKNLEEG